jgi:hypothetical protein
LKDSKVHTTSSTASLKDEFVLKKGKVTMPATAGSKGKGVKFLNAENSTSFSQDWRLSMLLSRGITQATEEAYSAMQQVMAYCVKTPNHGLLLAPQGQWSGHEDEKLKIKGECQRLHMQVTLTWVVQNF